MPIMDFCVWIYLIQEHGCCSTFEKLKTLSQQLVVFYAFLNWSRGIPCVWIRVSIIEKPLNISLITTVVVFRTRVSG